MVWISFLGIFFQIVLIIALFTPATQAIRMKPRTLDSLAQPSRVQRLAVVNDDLIPAATGHHGHGRVHIKVYRGPSDGHHASHGFWVKQPADD